MSILSKDNWRNSIAFVVVAFALLVTFAGMVESIHPLHIYTYDAKRYLVLVVSGLLVFTLFSLKYFQLLSTIDRFLLASMVLLVLVSASLSVDQTKSLSILASYFLFYLAFYCLSFVLNQKVGFGILLVCLGGVFLYSFIFIVQIFALMTIGNPIDNSENIFHGFTNPRYLNHLQTIVIPFIPLFLIVNFKENVADNFKNLAKVFYCLIFLGIVVYCSLLFFTSARGTFISVILALIVSALLYGRVALDITRKIALILLLAFAFFLMIRYLLPYLLEFKFEGFEGARTGLSARDLLWWDALEKFYQNPIWGVGLGMYDYAQNTGNHPHNIVLWLLSECGIVATTAIGFIAFRFLYVYWKRIKYLLNTTVENSRLYPLKLVSISIFTSLIAILIHGMVSGVYIKPSTLLVLIPLLAIALANRRDLLAFSLTGLKTEGNSGNSSNRASFRVGVKSQITSALLCLVLAFPIYLYWQRLDVEQQKVKALLEKDQFYLVNDYAAFFWLNGDL